MSHQYSLKDETQSSGTTKKTASLKHHPDHQAALKCPRCDSPNTKFCYYNNYSLSQPRHFCKTCRRYWTNGGSLRSVPIGGGCRKTKKLKSSSKLPGADSPRSSAASAIAGLNFFPPSIDFQAPGHEGLPFPRSYFSFDQTIAPNYSFMGLNYSNSLPISDCHVGPPVIHHNMTSNPSIDSTSIASSIESLSSLNQDLHWKLQQQRLSMAVFAGEDQSSDQKDQYQTQKLLQPILFQNLEVPKQEIISSFSGSSVKESAATGDATTEWFFGNSYAADPPSIPRNNGIQDWGDLQQFSTLP